jgi:hypothetical protein
MTRAAFRQADIERILRAAKAVGAVVQIDLRSLVVTVALGSDLTPSLQSVDPKPEDFTSLAEWQAWRDQERAREAQGRR